MGLFAFDLSDEAYKQGEAATRAQQTLLETLARPTLKSQIDSMWKRVATRPRRFKLELSLRGAHFATKQSHVGRV